METVDLLGINENPPTQTPKVNAGETEAEYQARKNAYQVKAQTTQSTKNKQDEKDTNFLRITLKLKKKGSVTDLENQSEFEKVELLRDLNGTSFADLELTSADFIETKKVPTMSRLKNFLGGVDEIGNKSRTGFGSTFFSKSGGKKKTKRRRARSRRLTK